MATDLGRQPGKLSRFCGSLSGWQDDLRENRHRGGAEHSATHDLLQHHCYRSGLELGAIARSWNYVGDTMANSLSEKIRGVILRSLPRSNSDAMMLYPSSNVESVSYQT